MKKITPKKLVEFVNNYLQELQAENIAILPVRTLTSIADYVVVCNGTSSRHVHAMAENLILQIKQQHKIQPLGVENDPNGLWSLIDLDAVIVHIMDSKTREFYNLEKLWDISKKHRVK